MTFQEEADLLSRAGERFEAEGNLVCLDSGRVVFVGDTHGDVEATEAVLGKYLNREDKVVFLGDYVDRGQRSRDNVNLLLSAKLDYPENLFLLMGNHEGRKATRFYPADFWLSLPSELSSLYETVLSKLPLVVSAAKDLVALHGALPEIEALSDIEGIVFGDERWRQITWGDWEAEGGRLTGPGDVLGRPRFGEDRFNQVMDLLGKRVLIRSHQPGIDPVIFGGRCLTIFTTSAYPKGVGERTIAIADLDREIRTVGDLVIETI